MNFIDRKLVAAYNRKIKAAAEMHCELEEYQSLKWRKSMAHWICAFRRAYPKRDIGVTFSVGD